MNAKVGKKEGMLTPIDKADEPLGTYHLDHVGPLTETKKMYNHILVVIDGFSKFMWLYPTKSTGVDEVLSKLKKQAAIFGNPKRIVTDRGSAFTSNNFKEYCIEENIQHLLITTGVPRGNGQVERAHKIIIPMVSKLSYEKPEKWYDKIEKVQQILNNTAPRSTGKTPFKILTGLDMKVNDVPDLQEMLNEYRLQELDENRNIVRQEAKASTLKIQAENKKTFDKNRKQSFDYEVGDLVAIKKTQYEVKAKLKQKYVGPYKITMKMRHDRYKVEKVGDHEGPNQTSTVAEFMKPWETMVNELSGRTNVGNNWH